MSFFIAGNLLYLEFVVSGFHCMCLSDCVWKFVKCGKTLNLIFMLVAEVELHLSFFKLALFIDCQ